MRAGQAASGAGRQEGGLAFQAAYPGGLQSMAHPEAQAAYQAGHPVNGFDPHPLQGEKAYTSTDLGKVLRPSKAKTDIPGAEEEVASGLGATLIAGAWACLPLVGALGAALSLVNASFAWGVTQDPGGARPQAVPSACGAISHDSGQRPYTVEVAQVC